MTTNKKSPAKKEGFKLNLGNKTKPSNAIETILEQVPKVSEEDKVVHSSIYISTKLNIELKIHSMRQEKSVSQLVNSFIGEILENGVAEDFSSATIEPTSNKDHKLTYYAKRGDIQKLREKSAIMQTTIRELLTFYILKELNKI